MKKIMALGWLVSWMVMPQAGHAEVAAASTAAQPPMHFMPLPPRNMRVIALMQRNRFAAHKPAIGNVRNDVEAEKQKQPQDGDRHKLLLYVYDEMR